MSEINPTQNQIIQQAWILLKLKRFADAKELLYKSLAAEPNQRESLYLLTHACINSGELDEADRTISSCINSYPEYADAFYLKSIVCIHKQEFGLALKMIDEAIRLFPYNPNYFLTKSNIYQRRGLPENAITFVDEGLRLNPENQHLLQQKAVLLFQMHDVQAEKYLSDAMVIDPEMESNFGIKGMLHLDKYEIDEAESNFLEALRLEPNNPQFLTGLLSVKKLRNVFYWETIKKGFRRMRIKSYRLFFLNLIQSLGLAIIGYLVKAAYFAFCWFADVLYETVYRLSASNKYLLVEKKILRSNIFLSMICVSVILMFIGQKFQNHFISNLGFLVFALIFPVLSFFEDWKRKVIRRAIIFSVILFGTVFTLTTNYSAFYFFMLLAILVYTLLWTFRVFGK